MAGIAQFFKVSENIFLKADNTTKEMYEKLMLPKRATKYSAGYDFFLPFDLELLPQESIKIPTGIRCKMDPSYVLLLFPRSSLGFKYRLQLDNTVGIIDADYFDSSNEGHIFIKLTNDSKDKVLRLKAGDAFSQGIFISYGLTIDDDTTDIRDGGFGSTNR